MIQENDNFTWPLLLPTLRSRCPVAATPPDSEPAERLDAVIISDIHLGSTNCQASALGELLQQILDGKLHTRRLIFNGDVFDSIDFRRLKKHHWKVLSLIRHLSDKMEVVWIAGNHDGPAEIVSNLLGVSVVGQYILTSGPRRILIVHGHQFDRFIQDHPVLTWLADCAYALLQKSDRSHYIARLAKRQSKVFLRCERKVRDGAVAMARHAKCDAVICGHTHHPVVEDEGPVRYYNSGCWTERPCHYLTIRQGVVTLAETSEILAVQEIESMPLARRAPQQSEPSSR